MSDGVTITVFGTEELIGRLSAKADDFEAMLTQRMHAIVDRVKNNVVQNHLSGPTGPSSLSRVRGNLARSVQTDVASDAATILGRIFYTGDVIYAAIHEFGGTIVPVKAKALRFMLGGKMIITQVVHMPARAPLRTGFNEMAEFIVSEIKAGVAEVVAK